MQIYFRCGLFVFVLLVAVSVAGDDQVSTINDVMVLNIAPATDILWGIEDPQSDEEWQVFIDAANVVIDEMTAIERGGAGPNDDTWAEDPAWQEFADRLIQAGIDAREAARNKDLDGMYDAGDALYTPCEECHIQFHPGLQ